MDETTTTPAAAGPAPEAEPPMAGPGLEPQFPPEPEEEKKRAKRIKPRTIASILFDVALIVTLPILITVVIGIYTSVRPEKILSAATPAEHGLAYEDVRLTTADGISIAGWLVPSKDAESRSAVVILHGYPADKGDLVSRAAFLAEEHALLFIDFRYFGESGGSMSTAGAREVEDALAAVAELKRRGYERIGIYGFSMGGAVALMAMPRSVDIDAVVAEAAYADLRTMAAELYRYLGPLAGPSTWLTAVASKYALGVDLDAVSPEKAVAGTGTPVLLVHSRNDKVIPFENAERIRAALEGNANAEFLFTEGQIHGEPSAEFAVRVLEFFGRRLKDVSPPAE